MKRISIWLGILLTLIGCQSANNGQNIDNTTVPALDIPRFMGNEGEKDGKHKQVTGRAKQPNPQDPGKLKVSFFLWFYSDYYILDLAPDYSYVLVSSSSDKYLWIMSRTPTLPQATLNRLLQQLQKRGYDTSRLIFVKQD